MSLVDCLELESIMIQIDVRRPVLTESLVEFRVSDTETYVIDVTMLREFWQKEYNLLTCIKILRICRPNGVAIPVSYAKRIVEYLKSNYW